MKTTLLLSIILTGLAAAGCRPAPPTSTTAGESYQNPPAADPKVAVDPSKPNSPANTVEGAARASKAAATAPSPATEPAMVSTPSNIGTRTPAVATSSSTGAAVAGGSAKSTTAGTSRSIDTSNSALNTRITEWRLGAAAIQADVDNGVTIVRRKESIMGALPSNTDDAVVTAMVKGQLQADATVSTARVDVKASGGEVTLTGTAANAAQVGHAIALALDTQGVTKVSSNIRVSK